MAVRQPLGTPYDNELVRLRIYVFSVDVRIRMRGSRMDEAVAVGDVPVDVEKLR